MIQNRVARECYLYANVCIEWENFRMTFEEFQTKCHILGTDPFQFMIEEIEVAALVQLFDSGGMSAKENILRKET